MKIKIKLDLPLAKRHGLVEGAVFEVLEENLDDAQTTARGVWVRSLAGEPVKVLHCEYTIVPNITERLNS